MPPLHAPYATRSVVRPLTSRSTLATAVCVVLLAVGWWSAVDAEFNITKCCKEGETLDSQYKCIADKRGSSYKFRVPKIVNKSGSFDFYDADEYNLHYEMNINILNQMLCPKKTSRQNFTILNTGYIQTISGEFSPVNFTYCLEEIFEDGKFSHIAVEGIVIEPHCKPGDEDCVCDPGKYNEKCPMPSIIPDSITSISITYFFSTFLKKCFVWLTPLIQ